MEIDIGPDPRHPTGGFAILKFRTAAPRSEVELAIRDLRKDIWLARGGWQNESTSLGLHEVSDAGNGWSQIGLGPGIVDQVPEDSYLEFRIGAEKGQAIWPDSIHCSPSAAGRGTIGTGDPGPEPDLSDDRRMFRNPAPPPPSEPEVTEVPDDKPAVVEPESATDRKSSPVLWVLALLLLAAVALGAYFVMRKDPVPEPPEPQATDCTDAGFTGRLGEPNEAQFAAFVECSESISEAMAYRTLDRLVASGFGPALFTYGRLYDSEETVDLPFDFSPSPTIAAEYYSRALAAGHAEAGEYLERTCAGLSLDDELHAMAHETHCP